MTRPGRAHGNLNCGCGECVGYDTALMDAARRAFITLTETERSEVVREFCCFCLRHMGSGVCHCLDDACLT